MLECAFSGRWQYFHTLELLIDEDHSWLVGDFSTRLTPVVPSIERGFCVTRDGEQLEQEKAENVGCCTKFYPIRACHHLSRATVVTHLPHDWHAQRI